MNQNPGTSAAAPRAHHHHHHHSQRLANEHLPLVIAIASQVKRRLSPSTDLRDLIGYGSAGLLEAAERYDPRRGVAFSTFAHHRIRGAMLDGVRQMGWYSRADCARYLAEQRVSEYLRDRADAGADCDAAGGGRGRASPDVEATLAALADLAGAIVTVHLSTLAAVGADVAPTAEARMEMEHLGARVRAAVAALPERERRLIELAYFAGQSFAEAAAAMGMSRSWISRLHARAIAALREALEQAPAAQSLSLSALSSPPRNDAGSRPNR